MEKLKRCEQCGEIFSFERNSAIYCSDACKQKAYLVRGRLQLYKAMDVEDIVIESIVEPPENEIESIVSFEEKISEPEVLNESEPSESPEPQEPKDINGSDKEKKREKSSDSKSTPKKYKKSNENNAIKGLLAIAGFAAVSYVIGKILDTPKTSEKNVDKKEPIVNGGVGSQNIDDDIQKPDISTLEPPDISQNQMDSKPNRPDTAEKFIKSDSLLKKISIQFNRMWESIRIVQNKKQNVEKTDYVQTENNETPAVDSSVMTEINKKGIESPRESDGTNSNLAEVIRIYLEKVKNESESGKSKPENEDIT
ncbi:MAG: hypothetical protein K0B15_09860 [Lentimicrobium sp.]|nr:hypothetical protein [Lentimicrobium sp.]